MPRGVTRPGHEVTLCTPTVKTWAVCSVDSQDMPGQWPLISVITGDNVGGSQLCSTHPSSGVGGYRERELVRILATPTMQGTIHLVCTVLCWFLSFYSRVWAFAPSPSTYRMQDSLGRSYQTSRRIYRIYLVLVRRDGCWRNQIQVMAMHRTGGKQSSPFTHCDI